MPFLLAALRLLAVVLWVGGLCFFAFVVAPVAFGFLADKHSAGLVVGGSLRVLHGLGMVAGVVFAAATLGRSLSHPQRPRRLFRLFAAELLAITAMLALTAYSQFAIIPRMDAARAEAGLKGIATGQSAGSLTFQTLHVRSERVEGTVLFLGLALVATLAWELATPTAQRP